MEVLKVAALQAHERYRQMRLALRQERKLHLQGLAVWAGKLVRTRNLSEAHRIVRELSGITQGGTPLALKPLRGTWPLGQPQSHPQLLCMGAECYQPCCEGPPQTNP